MTERRRGGRKHKKEDTEPINPHGSVVADKIAQAIDAFTIKDYSSDDYDKTIRFGNKIFGREVAGFVIEEDESETPYYSYFYEKPTDNPWIRERLIADLISLNIQSIQLQGKTGQISNSVGSPRPITKEEAEEFLSDMPKGPGDIRRVVKLQ